MRLDGGQGEPPPALLGWFFIVFALGFIFCGLGFAGCLVLAGRSLARRRRYVFCLVIAGLSCTLMPVGTILGVFTIVVLLRDSVKAQFGQPVAAGLARCRLRPAAGAGRCRDTVETVR